MKKMIYNFRHEKTLSDEITQRLKEHNELSQGWGGGVDCNLDLRKPDFVENCVAYHELKRTNVPSNLTRISALTDGDLIVTPHLPKEGRLSIHIVKGDFPNCYRYDKNDDSHQNHRILVKQSIGLGNEINIYNKDLIRYRTALRRLQYPVLEIPEFGEFFDIVEKFPRDPNKRSDASSLEQYLANLVNDITAALTENLRNIWPAGGEISFENLCERVLVSNGYKIVRRHWYDRQRGDVDLVCQRSRDELSVFKGREDLLYVQVKKHRDQTDEEAVNQLLRMMNPDSKADGCVMSLADGFTDDAKSLAKNNGIVLLNKNQICSLLLPLLADFVE